MAPQPGEETAANPERTSEDIYGGYEWLEKGASLYAGTVLWVRVSQILPASSDMSGECPPQEAGTIGLRVDRAVVGAPRQEMTIGYWCYLEDGCGGRVLTADWGCSASPWRERPTPGRRLLLLIKPHEPRLENLDGKLGDLVWHAWYDVGPNHPFVDGFADAARYLAATDDRTREALFRKLCRSDFASMRDFARTVAFHSRCPDGKGGYDAARELQRALEYLRLAVPKFTFDKEWSLVSYAFSGWLYELGTWRAPGRAVNREFLSAFEDWYLTELAALDHPERRLSAVEALRLIVHCRGAAGTLALFSGRGRTLLLERLRACADSPCCGETAADVLRSLGVRPGQ